MRNARVSSALNIALVAAVMVIVVMAIWEVVSGVPTSDQVLWRKPLTGPATIITAPIALNWWWHGAVWAMLAFNLEWLFSSHVMRDNEQNLLPLSLGCVFTLFGGAIGGLFWGLACTATIVLLAAINGYMNSFGTPSELDSRSKGPVGGVLALFGAGTALSFLFGPVVGLPTAALISAYVLGSKTFRE